MNLNTHVPLYALLLSVLVCATGCQQEKTAEAASQPPARPRAVKVARVSSEYVPRAIEINGTLAAQDQVVLGTKVAGRVGEMLVDIGSAVKKGQPVAKLDTTDLQLRVDQASAALQQARTRLGLPPNGKTDTVEPEKTALVRQAKAVLEEARLNQERAQQLYQQKLIAKSQFDSAVASWQVADGKYQDAVEEVRNREAMIAQRRSELDLARQQLVDAIILSPIDGAVQLRHASTGQFLPIGAPVVTVFQIDPLRLRLAVPERAAASVRIGQTVSVRSDPDAAVYQGRVVRLSPGIEETNRTLMIEAEVPNSANRLRPGAFAKAEIITQAGGSSLFIPQNSLVVFAGIEKVLTVENGASVEKTVRTGRRAGERIEITEGLKPGELVVLQPGNLIGGQPVTVER
jgi:RND family efflux transporter MFP subunit